MPLVSNPPHLTSIRLLVALGRGRPASPGQPSTSGIGVDGAIAVYWADTNPGATSALDPPGNVWYGPGDGGFVAEWSKCMYWSDPERPDVRNTFEAILYPGCAQKLPTGPAPGRSLCFLPAASFAPPFALLSTPAVS